MEGLDRFFDLSSFRWREIFTNIEYPWSVLEKGFIGSAVRSLDKPSVWRLPFSGYRTSPAVFVNGELLEEGIELVKTDASKGDLRVRVNGREVDGATWISGGTSFYGEIYIGPGSLIEEGAVVKGPVLLGPCCEVRQGAYVRGNVICGEGCVIGHASEVKGAVFLNNAKAPHFAYVGDSVLGNNVNLGAGTKISNLKITGDEIVCIYDSRPVKTGLRKFGALVGDNVETGCNCVLNPGTLFERGCMVYPCVSVRKGHYVSGTIIKGDRKRISLK